MNTNRLLNIATLEDVVRMRFHTGAPLRDWHDMPGLQKCAPYIVDASYAWNFNRDPSVYKRIMPMLPTLDGEYKEWDILYNWHARALGALGQYDKAYDVLEQGIHSCTHIADLLDTFGDLKFDQKTIEAFGWWMQSCIVGSRGCMPYLKLGVVAAQAGLYSLAKRLLDACDLLQELRLDQAYEDEIWRVAESEMARVRVVLRTFAEFMKPFLPHDTLLPGDQLRRSTLLSIGSQTIREARLRLIQR